MLNDELLSERTARQRLQKRRDEEAEARGRIFNDKVRTIGVDKEALDMQVKEKRRQEEAEQAEKNAHDAEMLRNSELASVLHRREVKEKQVMEKALVEYWQLQEQDQSQRELDLNDGGDEQMTLASLVGEDLDSQSRQLRQSEQLRVWLTQQERERQEERRRQKLEELRWDQSVLETDNRALQLQSAEMETRRAAAVALKEFNLAMNMEKLPLEEDEPSQSLVGVPGLCPSSARPPPESLQQVLQFRKHQLEEKKRMESERKQEEERLERARLTSARTARLMERQQARLNAQLRRHMDDTNATLAQTQEKPVIERGEISESFFSQFNTSRR